MVVKDLPLAGLKLIQLDVHNDKRGYFTETYNKDRYDFLPEFKQDNVSFSMIGVLRGLHYQETQPQGKLVSVISGCVFDAVLNIDPKHPEFGKWFGIKLVPGMQFYVPPFYAHGFKVLETETLFQYKCTEMFKEGDGRTIAWDTAGIIWPDIDIDNAPKKPFLSEQDKKGESFVEFASRKLI